MTIKTYIELEVEVEFDRVPGQTQTRHDPGFEESIEITGVTILQNQSALTLTPHQLVQVETDVWTHLGKMELCHD